MPPPRAEAFRGPLRDGSALGAPAPVGARRYPGELAPGTGRAAWSCVPYSSTKQSGL